MPRTIWFILNLVVYTAWYASKIVGAGLLRVPNRPGGVSETPEWIIIQDRLIQIDVLVWAALFGFVLYGFDVI